MASPLIGAHVSSSGGLGDAIRSAKTAGFASVQVFTSSPRMWKSSPATPEKQADFAAAIAETGISALVSHDTYLVNLCHPDPEVAAKSYVTLRDELVRCSAYKIPYVVSHIGGLMGQELAEGQKKAAEAVQKLVEETPDDVMVLMETTAGQGSSLNSRFDELADLLNLVNLPDRVGVCLDTCHVYAAGYDISTPEGYEATWQEFDAKIGLSNLKVIHVNDSKKKLGSRVDRHDNIGKGLIGLEAFRCLVNDVRFNGIPLILETPMEDQGHEKDLATLLGLQN